MTKAICSHKRVSKKVWLNPWEAFLDSSRLYQLTYNIAHITFNRPEALNVVAMIDLLLRPLPILGDPLPIFPENRIEEG